MSEDIHKWSDGRYVLMFDEHTFFVYDNEKEERMTALETTKKLNELSEENEKLRFLIDINSVSERTKLERQVDEQQATINDLEKQRDYWKNKAMTLLMQIRRLTSRMTDKEVKEFSKELEDE